MEKIRFEDLPKINPGDLVIIDDPLLQREEVYVFLVALEDTYTFIGKNGASLIVESQNTINQFNIKNITPDHSLWDKEFSKYGKEMNELFRKGLGGMLP